MTGGEERAEGFVKNSRLEVIKEQVVKPLILMRNDINEDIKRIERIENELELVNILLGLYKKYDY